MTRTRPLAASSLAALIVLLWPIAPTPAYAGETGEVELTVFAGSDKAGDSYRNGVPATQSTIDYPSAVAVAPDGTVYIAETTAIRAVSPSGMITTVAGTGSLASWTKDSSPIVNNQPATSVALQNPRSLSVGADGTVYIADELSRVLKLSPDGRISTLAGTGTKGYSGDGSPAQQAMLSAGSPSVAAAPDGTVYIGDTGNKRLRAVSPDGIITTVAGTGEDWLDAGAPDGGKALETAIIVTGVCVDSRRAVWMRNGNGLSILSGNQVATVTVPSSNRWGVSKAKTSPLEELGPVEAVAANDQGMYVFNGFSHELLRLGTGKTRTLETAGRLKLMEQSSISITVGPSGEVYVAEFESQLVYVLHPTFTSERGAAFWWTIAAAGTGVVLLLGLGYWMIRRRMRHRG